MTDKRPILALSLLALLAACGGDAPAGDGRAASGEVLEGTISDAMLPIDRVRSEAPLEDPEAFARASERTRGADDAAAGDADGGGDDASAEAGTDSEPEVAADAGED